MGLVGRVMMLGSTLVEREATLAFAGRLTAQKSLDLQYYLLQNDLSGHTLVRAVRVAGKVEPVFVEGLARGADDALGLYLGKDSLKGVHVAVRLMASSTPLNFLVASGADCVGVGTPCFGPVGPGAGRVSVVKSTTPP